MVVGIFTGNDFPCLNTLGSFRGYMAAPVELTGFYRIVVSPTVGAGNGIKCDQAVLSIYIRSNSFSGYVGAVLCFGKCDFNSLERWIVINFARQFSGRE